MKGHSRDLWTENASRAILSYHSDKLALRTAVARKAARRSQQGTAKSSLPAAKPRSVTLDVISARHLPHVPHAQATPAALAGLARLGYSGAEISALVVPKRTLARRRARKELLSVEETDRALRLERIATLAERVFADATKARRWLRKPKRSLNGAAPLAFLASEASARLVEEMLYRIEHGMAA